MSYRHYAQGGRSAEQHANKAADILLMDISLKGESWYRNVQ